MLDTIRYTLIRIFDFYRQQGRAYTWFGPLYVIVALAAGVILSALICWVAMNVYTVHSYTGEVLRHLDGDAVAGMQVHWSSIMSRFAEFFMIAFAAYAPAWSAEPIERLRLGDVKRDLVLKHGNNLFVMLVLLCVVELLLFNRVFGSSLLDDAVFPRKDYDEGSRFMYELTGWINYMVGFIHGLVPCIAGVLFVVRASGAKYVAAFSRYRTALFASLILVFCLLAVQNDLLSFFSSAWPVLMSPFNEPAIPIVLGMAVVVFLFGSTLPAYAGIVRAPLDDVMGKEHLTSDAERT